MRAYVINVDSAVERRSVFMRTTAVAIRAAGVTVERVSAVTPEGLPDWERESGHSVGLLARKSIREGSPIEPVVIDSIRSMACVASHIRAWRRFLSSGDKWGIIFEDDAIVASEREVKDVKTALKQIRDTEHPFDVVLLGWTRKRCNRFPRAEEGPWLDVNRDGPRWWTGAQAYVIRRDAAARLVKRYAVIDFHVDTLLMMCGNEGEVRVGATDYLCIGQQGKSTLGHSGNRYERAILAISVLSGTVITLLLIVGILSAVVSRRRHSG